jgi:hypothetical protein
MLSTNDLREDALLVLKTHVLLKQKEARHGNASLSLKTPTLWQRAKHCNKL